MFFHEQQNRIWGENIYFNEENLITRTLMDHKPVTIFSTRFQYTQAKGI